MDDNGLQLPQTTTSSMPAGDIAGDLEHINHEMYKKNVELLERNRTLSLLRKIDEIILSTATNVKEITQSVTKVLITDAGFKLASILLLDKNAGRIVVTSLSESEALLNSEMLNMQNASFVSNFPMSDEYNIFVQAITQRTQRVTNNYHHVAFHALTPEQAAKIQQAAGVISFIVHPLIVRGDAIGAICIGLAEDEKTISEYQRDLINRVIGVIGIAVDNALLYNEVKSANEKLQALDKVKDEFVSLASHELRTPMTAIKSYLWMLLAGKAGPLSDKQHFYLDRAYSSTDRLLKLVNDMLNISRIESGRISLDMQLVQLDILAQDVVLEVMPRAEELGLEVVVQKPEKSVPQVYGDPDKLKEVLLNLLGNAMKFTQKGGKITISFTPLEKQIEITITDTGSGISAEDLSKLFQKFGLLPGAYAASGTSSQGSGLGLYICRKIIELHHGSIQATSPGVGKGSSFIIMLPVYDAKAWEQYRVNKNANHQPQTQPAS